MRISGSDSPGLRHFLLLLSSLLLFPSRSQSSCDDQCTAVAAYYVSSGQDLTSISRLFGIEPSSIDKRVLPYNNLTSKDSIGANSTVYIPFDCACMGSGDYLGHNFTYIISSGQTYNTVAQDVFVNLTTADWLARVNTYPPNRIPDNVSINVVVNCSCGDRAISTNYGLFATYPLRPGQTLASVANATGFPSADLDMLPKYNPGVSLNGGQGIVFLPVKDANGSYHPLSPSKGGISGGAIAGISVAVVVALILIVGLYIIYRGKKPKRPTLLYASEDQSISHGQVSTDALAPLPGGTSPFVGITVDRSVEFSYEELAKATDNFNLSNKIGEGGFGAVYYAELKGEKTAIKKMDMQASREFLAELKVLTHVHHLNLVRLVGYCIEGSLFLIYEYIENGNLSQHLRSSGREPLSWSQRVQIALDSARGLEYIHEHTVPVYIHRDIKSANILIDKNFHAKVADFGLTKLTEVGSTSLQSRLVGTFGYMPPEYAQYGDVSPKIDVYAFGVVLYELISAKAAVMKTDTVDIESKGLVAMFEDVLSKSDKEALRKVVDPRLGENYPIDAVYKMALLAKACTQEKPELRPSMRSIVVALMTLSSATEDWDVGQFYENHALVNLMSGR